MVVNINGIFLDEQKIIDYLKLYKLTISTQNNDSSKKKNIENLFKNIILENIKSEIDLTNLFFVSSTRINPIFNNNTFSNFIVVKPVKLGIVNDPMLWFKNENFVPIRLRLNNNNLIEMINLIHTVQIDIDSLISEMQSNNYSIDFITNILNGKLVDIVYNKDNIYSIDFKQKILNFYKDLCVYIYTTYNCNLIFYRLFSLKPDTLQDSNEFPWIYSSTNINIDNPTYMFFISLPDSIMNELITNEPSHLQLHFHKSFNSENPDSIIYEYIPCLNLKDSDSIFSLDFNIDISLVSKFIIEKKINQVLDEEITTQETKESLIEKQKTIEFNPYDKINPLKIIEIDIPNVGKKNFLLGVSGNLYEDDDEKNDLVGKIENVNLTKSTGSTTVYWCKEY